MKAWLGALLPSVLASATGCGRWDFDLVSAPIDATADTSTDTPADAAPPTGSFTAATAPGSGVQMCATVSWNQTIGDLLLVPSWVFDGTSTFTVTDSLGQTWSASLIQTTTASDCGTQARVQFLYTIATSTGPVQVMECESATSQSGFMVATYQGVAATSPLELTAGQAATAASNAMTSGPFTTTSSDLIIALLVDNSGTGMLTASSPFVIRANDPSAYLAMADDAPGALPGVHEVTAALPTGVSNDCWIVQVVAFRTR